MDILTKKQEKTKQYETLFMQIKALMSSNENRISNMANFTAAVKSSFGFFWVGFYLAESNDLVLGPFQGPVACMRIAKGKGVCGLSWSNEKSIIVGNVHEFPGHIACSPESNSEIVIPLIKDRQCIGVLDIDSKEFDCFDEIDQLWLERLCSCLTSVL
tara:strand:+ start:157 stop:630 length:474 start_codon:yes stop_codon:yes gene_type:complete